MRVPLSWLAAHVDGLPTDADAVGEAFVRVGLEVEDVHRGPELPGPLVAGRVVEIEELTGLKKPIRWCRVDTGSHNGDDGPRGVICGARNFAVGDLVVVALPGAVLPGGFTISARKTYGHVSDGMIASARELGIGSDHAGILVLPPGAAAPGEDATVLLGLDDAVIELAVTPDRGYCFSVRGLARELAGAFDSDFVDPATPRRGTAGGGRRVAGRRWTTRPARGSSPAGSTASTRPPRARGGCSGGCWPPGCARSP